MMRPILFILALLFTTLATAQYGNEWIDYSQKYYEIPVGETGVYRIDSTTLSNVLSETGDDLTTIDPRNFQVFGREQEQYIYVEGESDGVFNASDYILFYAKKNDVWLDSTLFDDPDLIMNREQSFTSDSIRYFLTWNNSISNRRIKPETDVNFSGYTLTDYCWKTSSVHYENEYFVGEQFEGLSRSKYESGEGWAALRHGVAGSRNSTLSTVNAYYAATAPPASVWAISAGASAASLVGGFNHRSQISYTDASGGSVLAIDTSFLNYHVIHARFDIPNSSIPASSTTISHFTPSVGLASDYQTVGQVVLEYPHTFDFENRPWFEFDLDPAGAGKHYVSISNFNGTTPHLWVFSGDTVKEISLVSGGGIHEGLVPNNATVSSQHLLMFDESEILDVTDLGAGGAGPKLLPVSNDGLFLDYASMNIDSAYLVVAQQLMLPEARAYAAYRASSAGGSYDTLVLDVDQLYRQFGGGVVKSGLSIRRFAKYTFDNWPSTPGNLFLIGKSVMEASEGNAAVLATVTWGIVEGLGFEYQSCLVPSIGYPSSDDYLTKFNTDSTLQAGIPTGRLSAKTKQDVVDYLNKVIQFEANQDPNSIYTIADKEWQKYALHFGGGSNAGEQALLANALNSYKNIYETNGNFGGFVETHLKVNSDPISPVILDEVGTRLRDGVSLITFFGHATTNGFDQNIDNPDTWGNTGKYPVVLGLGCYAGDIHQPYQTSASETFVVLPDQGAIAFLANVKIGYTNGLSSFANGFYTGFCDTLYGESIGRSMQYSKASFGSTAHITEAGSVGSLSLQGDPAIRLNPHNAPELVLSPSRVFMEPEEVTVATDSIDLHVVITNLGQAIHDSVTVEITRHYPTGTDSLYLIELPRSLFRDTIVLTMPLNAEIAEGINSFDIKVDIPSQHPEQYDEINNNQLVYTTYFQLDGIEPIYPYDYAIVPNDSMTLKASTIDPFAPSRTYRFEIDTLDSFNTGFLKSQIITSEGGVVELLADDWVNVMTGNPDTLRFTDSTVYFWRAAADSTTPIWKERSFQYIPTKVGWGQAHFHQFKNNSFTNLEYDKPLREFRIGEVTLPLTCNTINNMVGASDLKYCEYFISSTRQDYSAYGTSPFLHLAVIDPVTLEPWGTPRILTTGDTLNWYNDYGQYNDGSVGGRQRSDFWFAFRQNNASEMAAIQSMIDTVPNGHYILLYTINKADYTQWNLHAPGLYGQLVALGSDSMAVPRPDESFIFFCRKGDPTTANEVYSLPDSLGIRETITLTDSLEFPRTGLMTSTLIGPALKWNTLYWQQNPYELPNNDSTRIKLYGVKYSGVSELLMDSTFSAMDSVLNLDFIIPAADYPFARVEGFYADNINQTPAQTIRWQVLYNPAPELALNKKKGFYFSIGDSVNHGDSARFAIAIENVSEFGFDSLLVHYSVEDQNSVRQYINYPRQDSLRPGEVLLDTITIATANLPNDNRFWIEANPYVLPNRQDQNEQYFFNNVAFIDFHAETDKINPILDVTFDGLHILNRDVVSSKPFITISLDDENPFFLFDSEDDTANFKIFLLRPGQVTHEVLNFRDGAGNEIMRFLPATGSDNKCSIEYNAEFTTDGIYTLLVQAKDKSNNASGSIDYEIEFEVVNRSTITNVMNYPNPFTTRTQFVFTLTGSVIPDYFKIQILTASGRVVREITRDELGPLRIGRNITDFYWDGTDQFGDRLAAGVYFYTVTTKINGEDIEHRDSGADSYFKKEFGKMYLMSY